MNQLKFQAVWCNCILTVSLKLLLQAIVDVLSNTLEETNLNGWKDLQEVY